MSSRSSGRRPRPQFQARPEHRPQPGHGLEEDRSADGPLADLVPAFEQLVRLSEHLPPDFRAVAVAVDHRREPATETGPANLSGPELAPPVTGEPVADGDRPRLLAEWSAATALARDRAIRKRCRSRVSVSQSCGGGGGMSVMPPLWWSRLAPASSDRERRLRGKRGVPRGLRCLRRVQVSIE